MKGDRRDAVRVWHLLDRALPNLREMRNDFEDAGLENEAWVLQEVVEKAEVKYAKAESEVAKFLGDGREEAGAE